MELAEGISVITVMYEEKTASFTVTVTEAEQGAVFGTFTSGYALSKATSNNSSTGMKKYGVYDSAAASRAAMTVPIINKGYVITVTDSSKYAVAVYDIVDNTENATTNSAAVLKKFYQRSTKTISWLASDSATTEYIMISLKKNDNTEFTVEELANGAEAVFTYTTSS